MVGRTPAELEAIIQADAIEAMPPGIETRTRQPSSGSRRAAQSLRPVRDADLVHGLDVDLPVLTRCPMVTTVHDLSVFDVPWAFPRYRVAGERALIARAIRVADAVIAVSAFTAERIEHHFGRISTVIPLAAEGIGAATGDGPTSEGSTADVRRRHRLPERFVLQVASIEPRKDVAGLARACRRLGIPLVLAGRLDGGGEVPDGAHHLGYVSAAELPAVMAAADIVAYLSHYEGFGLPPIEAMAMGRPVVASAVGALPDVVGDGAVLVGPGDDQALVDALGSLWCDDGARADLGRRGRLAAGRLSWTTTADRTLDVYRRLGVAV